MDTSEPVALLHEKIMLEAVELAREAAGFVEPNPMVGALLVDGRGRIVGRGRHERFGQAHAEVNAIADCRAAGVDPADCTLYVTLEPCSFHGKTPPCVDAVLEAGIRSVVAAMEDPNARVAGAGFARLREAGVRVLVGPGAQAARDLNPGYIKRMVEGLPCVTAKWAQTLDGAIATRAGHSQWISNSESRKRVHELRARVDAIVVGLGTVLADNPMLNARDVQMRRIARRVVVDSHLRIPDDSALLHSLDVAPVTIAVSSIDDVQAAGGRPVEHAERVAALRRRGVEVLELPVWRGACNGAKTPLDLASLLRRLAAEHGVTNVLVEGGGRLTGSLMLQGLVDRCLVFVAPKVLGDVDAVRPVVCGPAEHIDQSQKLELLTATPLAGDLMLEYRVRPAEAKG